MLLIILIISLLTENSKLRTMDMKIQNVDSTSQNHNGFYSTVT